MAVDGCGLVCKYILIIFNIIFAVVGFAFLGLGLWFRFSDSTRPLFNIAELNSSAFVTGVTVLIVLGVIMLIVVTFGDYGACSEKRGSLQVFSALLIILAIAEIIVGVLAYGRRDMVGNKLGEFYVSLYTLYVNSADPAMAVTLAFIHNSLHCCGLTGVSLVEVVQHTCPAPDGFMEHIAMPSCPMTIISIFDTKASLVLGIFVGTAGLLILALICSAVLSASIRQSSSSPQYIVLTQNTPGLAPLQPFQHVASAHPDQDPVVFTPLSVITALVCAAILLKQLKSGHQAMASYYSAVY